MKLTSRLIVPGARAAATALALAVGWSALGGLGPESGPVANAGFAVASTPPSTPAALPVVASAGPDPHQDQTDSTLRTTGLTVAVNAAERDSGGIVTVTWTLTNTGGDTFGTFGALSDNLSGYYGRAVSDVQLIDRLHQVRYHPLIDTQQVCYCSRGASADDNLTVGHRITLVDLYRPDPGTNKVDVQVKGFQPAQNVSIS